MKVPPLKTDRNLVNNILSMDKTFAASIGAVLPEPKFLSSVVCSSFLFVSSEFLC